MVADRNEDLDVIGIADDELEAAVQVFFVRRGRVVGRKGFIVDKVEDLDARRARRPHPRGASTTTSRRSGVPKQVLVPVEPDDPSRLRGVAHASCGARGSQVRVPQRGDKRALQETVTRNAKEEFTRHRLRRAADHNSRARALNELQDAARPARGAAAHRVLRHEPHPGHRLRRLDGGDGGRPAQEERVPPLQGQGASHGNDDFAAMEEVLTRRLTAYLAERDRPVGRARRASSPTRRSCCWSTAARASWRWPCGCVRGARASTTRSRWRRWPSGSRRSTCPGRADPVRIPRQSEALYLLQRIRDEAHRFAITYHRELRGKRMTTSVLDDIPGLGPTRQKRLVKELGGVTAVKQASLDELQALPWLPDAVAEAVYDKIHEPARRGSPGAPT